jgi:Plant mobile domain
MFYILQPYSTFRLNTHRLKVPYNEQMDPYLHKLGLYQMTIMGDCQMDKSLITTLVERWRTETSTLHLPFDEMTVTLEDIDVTVDDPSM